MKFPHVASRITTLQITSTAVAKSIGSGGNRQTNRVLLKASAATIYVGGGGVTTATGAEIPTGAAAPYLELWIRDPEKLYVVGVGTVYVILEEPEDVQT